MTDYFLGSHCYSAENSSYKFWIEIDIIAKKIIKIFSENMGVDLSKDKVLLKGIINHLKPTIYRLKNKQILENSILKDFLKLYKPIFMGTKKSIKPLKNFINLDITEDEIAFLAIHFKAALDRANKLENRKNNILVVCSSGYGTSKLLSQQINENFSVNIVEVIPFYRLKDYSLDNVDLIIGTINMDEVELKKPCITINTILSKEDVVLDVECESWEEAIRMAGEIMSNKVTLPHSKNNGNVFKSKMVLMNFRRDILFPEETPVKTMLTFTSQDENTHLDALSNFLDLVSNYKFLEKLENNPSKKKVIDIIKKYEFLSNLGKNRDIN